MKRTKRKRNFFFFFFFFFFRRKVFGLWFLGRERERERERDFVCLGVFCSDEIRHSLV